MAFQPNDKAMLEGYIQVARPLEEMFSVKGKVALVPGGSSGLGFDIAYRLLQGGAKVVIASNSTVEEEAAMDLLQKYGFGDSVKFCFCDVREEEQVAKLVDFTVDSFGTVDILINSAATWNYAHLCDLPREDLERVMDTNVNGAFFLVKYVSRYMIDHKIPGKMVFIASNSPWMPYPVFGGYSHYAASKGAVVALATQAAKELKRYGIMVNAVAPGYILTPMAEEDARQNGQSIEEYCREFIALHPIGRLGTPEEVAKAYLYLACADSAFVTGTTLMVDGGYTAQ